MTVFRTSIFGALNADTGVPNTDFGALNTDFGVMNPDAGVPNTDFDVPNADTGVLNTDFYVFDSDDSYFIYFMLSLVFSCRFRLDRVVDRRKIFC